ncbi:MAG: hemolysin family protein [bacterium]|nr:hemolysin family protein [bacterium]
MIFILSFLIIVICIGLAGFFSGCEMGFISINKIRLRHLVEKKYPRAVLAYELLKDTPQVLACLIVGINLAIITASCVNTSLAHFNRMNIFWAELILTFILLLFGEIIPKTLFRHHPTKLILSLIYPLRLGFVVLSPVVNLITKVTNPIIDYGQTKEVKSSFVTKEELRLLISAGEEAGSVDEEEEEMLEGVLNLSTTRVKEVMTPRTDMICLEVEANISDLLSAFEEHPHSRIPVYDETIDNIVGIIYIKDILNFWEQGFDRTSVMELIRFPYFVPTSKRVDVLLTEFQNKHLQIAIVVDEYGGVAGLVTLEDLLEEIVGEIRDEYETKEILVKPLKDGVFLVDARTSIEILNEDLKLDLPEADFETISGLILELLGRIPRMGEVVKYKDLTMTIIEADEKSISRVKVEVRG